MRIQQILLNLLSNAIKFSPHNQAIKVYLKVKPSLKDPQKKKVTICVKDSGIGITDQDKQNLFKAYFRTTDAQS